MNVLSINNLSYSWPKGPTIAIESLNLAAGDALFLHGPSGSGKTTLLGLAAGILAPDQGSIELLGCDIAKLSSHARDQFRGDNLGYIFQMFNLIPYLSVVDNIKLGCSLNKNRRARVKGNLDTAARELASHLEIVDQLDKPVTSLSVGQQQRVAAARALLGSPPLIIADEPTSALDFDQRARFIELLFNEAKESQAAILFVSHDHSLQPLFPRTLALKDLLQRGPEQ